jgi:hypothetical protein
MLTNRLDSSIRQVMASYFADYSLAELSAICSLDGIAG